jgi:Cu/Ag efflux pump CusA
VTEQPSRRFSTDEDLRLFLYLARADEPLDTRVREGRISMLRKLIEWSLENPVVVIALAVTLAGIGAFSFLHVNVEAYPDPAPAIVEVFAQMPGASAEEIERQVTIPLEVTFAGMPGIKIVHSKSLFGLSDLKMNWHYGNQWTYEAGRQEVINRISTISQPLPANVTPQISPESPTGEIYRYVLTNPKDARGRGVYTLNDLKAEQDWVLEREFRTVQRIVDVSARGVRSAAMKSSRTPTGCDATASRSCNCRTRLRTPTRLWVATMSTKVRSR